MMFDGETARSCGAEQPPAPHYRLNRPLNPRHSLNPRRLLAPPVLELPPQAASAVRRMHAKRA